MHRRSWTYLLPCVGFLVLILDAKTALQGAAEGIELCIKTVIPALFPFFMLSILLTSALIGHRNRIFAPIGALCGMPKGSESLLLVGLLGGYPTGAQAVNNAYTSGQISKEDGQRLLAFCSNAGPSFIFGMLSIMFPSAIYAWAIWVIHVLSAVLVGALLPGKSKNNTKMARAKPIMIPAALERSIKIMASVCAWVVLFRVIIAFAQRWFLWLLPGVTQTIFIGILELSNGCCALSSIPDIGLRFVVCSGLLTLGGFCVTMQTVSVTKELGMGMYFPGKALQCLISLALSSVFALILGVNSSFTLTIPAFSCLLLGIFLLLFQKNRKKSRNPLAVGV